MLGIMRSQEGQNNDCLVKNNLCLWAAKELHDGIIVWPRVCG